MLTLLGLLVVGADPMPAECPAEEQPGWPTASWDQQTQMLRRCWKPPIACPAEEQPEWATATELQQRAMLRGCQPPLPSSVPGQPDRVDRPLSADAETEQQPARGPGVRWGVVSLLGGSVGTPAYGQREFGVGGVVAIGPRYGLRTRNEDPRMLMPAVSGVIGSTFGPRTFAPFVEGRFELGTVARGGPLQPSFSTWAATGMSMVGSYQRPGRLTFGPHLGLGVGWNWLPQSMSGGSSSNFNLGSGWGGNPLGLLLIPVVIAVAAVGVGLVFAGKLELRYTQDTLYGPGFFSLTLGLGS